ncbi:ornithine cyclodeaminase family protein [Streptomyces canus]|uniref:ornithine cyclodeaminase family protein n=1 Tax=Streptomyces canus TaxID=58343 RepID=UPI0033B75683
MLRLTEADIAELIGSVDVVGVVREVLLAHAAGRAILPEESCLRWTNDQGESCRSLNMPGMVEISGRRTAGTKIINASLGNPDRGLPRASGVVLLFDTTTAGLVCTLDAAQISATRTAAVSVLAAELLWAEPVRTASVIGAGTLAETHLDLAARRWPTLRRALIHDRVPQRAELLAKRMTAAHPEVAFDVAPSAEEAVREAEWIVPVTTTTTGYIPARWINKGAVVVNVSLDDLLPEVYEHADRVIVDDWGLIAADTTRLLGRMHRAGDVLPPPRHRIGPTAGQAPAVEVAAELRDLIGAAKPIRESPDERIVVNPFGMSLHDVALAGELYESALRQGMGQRWES